MVNLSNILWFNLSLHCTVLFTKKKLPFLQTKHEIRPFVLRQNRANIPLSVPTSLHYLVMNLYNSLSDFILLCHPVERAL